MKNAILSMFLIMIAASSFAATPQVPQGSCWGYHGFCPIER